MVEDKNFLTTDQIDFIDTFILGDNFPYYLNLNSVTNDGNKYLCHSVVKRPEEREDSEPFYNSNYHEPILNIFRNFVVKNNIEVQEVLRCSVNLTFNTMEDQCPVHNDHEYPHKQFLMYLNDCFDKDAKTIILKNNEKYEIVPEKFKGICFDSSPHYMIYPKKDIRVVLVVTFR